MEDPFSVYGGRTYKNHNDHRKNGTLRSNYELPLFIQNPLRSTVAFNADLGLPKTLFVGDLSSEVNEDMLKKAFGDVKIIRDLSTCKPKGYGFVTYERYEEAKNAIEKMNGTWIGNRTIRTNWATRKTSMDVWSS